MERKGACGPSKRGNAQGPPRLTSTNWLATPTRLILLRFSHQCPLPLPHNVKERIRAPAKIVENYRTKKRATCTIAFWCVLQLFVLSKQLGFCLAGQLLGVVAHRYEPIIYLQTTWHKHTHACTRTHTQPLSFKMYNLADHSVISLFFFSFCFIMHNVWVYGNICTPGKFKCR